MRFVDDDTTRQERADFDMQLPWVQDAIGSAIANRN